MPFCSVYTLASTSTVFIYVSKHLPPAHPPTRQSDTKIAVLTRRAFDDKFELVFLMMSFVVGS